ncbi:SprT family zinc-dependent metalloprotease [Desulfitobacterium sp.]|uniref:M48 family metallopeptidase n=1 Tax=Desulfitobacterium sp. TaxID=49981 RepID=UPI002CC9647A|nr:SprT family zinc-dependent metalloprotease [Desulfitobacterium sp.]HVJ49358.1 SprT family zinc-dependent metalloprotease [Desulfitobacterium sp.]
MIASVPTSIAIHGTIIPYEERKNSRSKRLSIRVGRDRVRVTVPCRATQREIREFVKANQDWILAHWLKIQEKLEKVLERQYRDGESLPVLGQSILLQILKTNRKMIALRYDEGEKRVEIRLPEMMAPEHQRDAIKEILEKWLKIKAREVFQAKLTKLSVQMGVHYREFRLKEQKTRWGSCSSKGNINLNWRAIMAPEPVVDYLVIHELAHLKQMNHSPAFWDFVGQYCPEYGACRRWLKVNGERLIL